MSAVAIAVALKAPDPAAVTALSTIRRILPEIAPRELRRYERWEFSGPLCTAAAVAEAVGHFDDIVNPNKQIWFALDRDILPGESPDLLWCPVVVTDREDSFSENWTAILARRGFPFERVVRSVLWRLGFPSGLPSAEIRARSLTVALTTRREGGLLANPVSQSVSIPEPV